MRALKVKFKHCIHDFGGIVLAKHLVQTVVKHNYAKVQIGGKLYNIELFYCLPKKLGYLPIIQIHGFEDDYYNSQYNLNLNKW